jgi:hypothetical protein
MGKPGKKKQIFNVNRHCGANAKQSGKPCLQPKGQRTSHPGEGRCWMHGGLKKWGDRRVKHGLNRKKDLFGPYLTGALEDAVDHVKNFDLMDLTPHLELLNGLLADFIRRQQSTSEESDRFINQYGSAINTIVSSSKPDEIDAAVAKLKESANVPRGGIDIDSAAVLVERISRVVEKVHRIEQTSAVTVEAVNMLLERMAMVVFKHVKDDEVLEAVKRDWAAVEQAYVAASRDHQSSG